MNRWGPYNSKYGPWTSICITWLLVRDATSQTPPETCWINLQFIKSPRRFLCTLQSRTLNRSKAWTWALWGFRFAVHVDEIDLTMTHLCCGNLTLTYTSYFFLPASRIPQTEGPLKFHCWKDPKVPNSHLGFSSGFHKSLFTVEIPPPCPNKMP